LLNRLMRFAHLSPILRFSTIVASETLYSLEMNQYIGTVKQLTSMGAGPMSILWSRSLPDSENKTDKIAPKNIYRRGKVVKSSITQPRTVRLLPKFGTWVQYLSAQLASEWLNAFPVKYKTEKGTQIAPKGEFLFNCPARTAAVANSI